MEYFYTLVPTIPKYLNITSTNATNEVKTNRGQYTYTKHRQCVQSVVVDAKK